MSDVSDEIFFKLPDIKQNHIIRRYRNFDLIGTLCFVKRRCVGFTSLTVEKDDQYFELSRQDIKKIKRNLNKRVTCETCECCMNAHLPLTIITKGDVSFHLEKYEICQFRKCFFKWASKAYPQLW